MIERDGNAYTLQCDCCPMQEGQFADFGEALAHKQTHKHLWKSVRVKGEWLDVCIDCYNQEFKKEIRRTKNGKVKIDFGG